MATNKYSELLAALTNLQSTAPRHSESQNASTCNAALKLIWESDLPEQARKTIYEAISSAANPSGWYYENNGIQAGIERLEAFLANAQEVQKNDKVSIAFNLANLQNLVSDGAIFSVWFIKRSSGDLRKMVCRLGVKKHLKGGSKAYDPKQHNLLTVFDMEKAGYRSIPVDAIRRLSVHGQTFDFAEV